MSVVEASLARRLAHMRWIATGLLVTMGVLFVVASLLVQDYPWLGLFRAFAEAGMIGALADWFAVTALFRRPLGLPIPHTAIVPSRKDEIGQALARFIRDHFLVKDAVAARLANVDLAGRIGLWLDTDENSQAVSRDLSVVLEWLVGAFDSADLRASLRGSLRSALDEVPASSALSVAVEVFMTGNHAQPLVNQLVQFGRDQLDNNRERIRARVADRSPWWLPKFVDEEIYDQLVAEMGRILDEIGADPSHPARAELNERLGRIRVALTEDPVLVERGQVLKDEFFNHPAVSDYFHELWLKISECLRDSLRDPASPIRAGMAGELRSVGRRLREDTDVNERLNRWLRELALYLVENYRQPLSEFISDTIEQWDPTATSERIELYIGRDLQFIRINGTLVGGLVGVAIYLIWGALV